MRPELEQLYEIDQYLAGNLKGDDKLGFETKLATDPDLYKEFQLQKKVEQVVVASAYHDLRLRIKSDLTHYDHKAQVTRNVKRLGGIVFFFVGALLYLIQVNKPLVETKKNGADQQYLLIPQKFSVPTEGRASNTSIIVKENKRVTKNKTQMPVRAQEGIYNNHIDAIIINTKDAKGAFATNLDSEEEIETPKISESSAAEPIENATINCNLIRLTASPKVTPSCSRERLGIIDFHGAMVGGSSPYKVQSIEKQVDVGEFYDGLAPGSYDFTITDAQGCSSNITIVIPHKACMNEMATLNTDLMETWNIPYDKDKDEYTLTIINKGGIIEYQQMSASISGNMWDGRNNRGEVLPPDLYVYTITYKNGAVDHGQISIVR